MRPPLRRPAHRLLRLAAPAEDDEAPEGREPRRLALDELALGEGVVVLARRGEQHGVLGKTGLDDHLASVRASPGASRHLREQLEAALGGAEVREVKAGVGGDHADESHLREVEALGHHLRTEQHVGLPPAESLDQAVVGAFPSRGVHIHTNDADPRELFLEGGLHLLGPRAGQPDLGTAAGRALAGYGRAIVAVVAAQALPLTAVVGEGDLAPAAGDGLAAAGALHDG